MALRLVVYAVVIILGLAIAYAGTRLLTGRQPDPNSPTTPDGAESGQASPVSGIVFIVVGVLMIALAVRMIAAAQHEVMTAVSPTSYLDLNTPPGPTTDTPTAGAPGQ